MYRFGSLAAAVPSPNPGSGKDIAAPLATPVLPAPAVTPESEPKQPPAGVLAVGSYVQLGRYQEQPLLWQVIRLEAGQATLFAHQVLPSKSFDAAGDNLGKTRDPKGHALRLSGSSQGKAAPYWLSTPLQGAASTVRYVNSDSLILYEVAYGTMGIRPALVISTDGLTGAGTMADPYRVSF